MRIGTIDIDRRIPYVRFKMDGDERATFSVGDTIELSDGYTGTYTVDSITFKSEITTLNLTQLTGTVHLEILLQATATKI